MQQLCTIVRYPFMHAGPAAVWYETSARRFATNNASVHTKLTCMSTSMGSQRAIGRLSFQQP
jgi:hypothetical protein